MIVTDEIDRIQLERFRTNPPAFLLVSAQRPAKRKAS